MTEQEAIDELQRKPVVDIIVAGRALGVGSSRAYQLADNGTIPTIRLSKGRRKVPSAPLLEKLGLRPASQPQPAA